LQQESYGNSESQPPRMNSFHRITFLMYCWAREAELLVVEGAATMHLSRGVKNARKKAFVGTNSIEVELGCYR
jgi:hypothetical protein